MNEFKFSVSKLKAGDNEVWSAFLGHLLPRIDALLKKTFAGGPKRSFCHIDTIKSDVTILLWSKIESCELDDGKDLVRLGLGIACTKARQVGLDKRYSFMHKARRAGRTVTNINSKMPAEFFAVQGQDPESREENKQLRKAISFMLNSYSKSLDTQLNQARGAITSSPLLIHSVFDAACNDKHKRGLLSTYMSILKPYELTRLKTNALETMGEHLKLEATFNNEFTGLNWESFKPGGLIAEIWHDYAYGCFKYIRGLDAMHQSHEKDLFVYKEIHLNLCACPICCITNDEQDQERLESWGESLQESIMKSR